MRVIKICFFLFILSFLSSCGDREDEKVSKGHRDAMKYQCEDTSNSKVCRLEVEENFISDGNEYADFSVLTNDEIDLVKFECVRKKKYGLVSYNNCLNKYIVKLEENEFFNDPGGDIPDGNIEELELSVVYIEMTYANYKLKEPREITFGSGSGVIISDKDIATNCHVAMAEDKKILKKAGWNRNDVKKLLWVKTLGGKDWAEAKLIKHNERKDICIIRHEPKKEFKIKMKPIKKFVSFDKIKRGDFVRAMGSPGGMIGHTSEGSVQWLGTIDGLERSLEGITEFYDKDTKVIVHGARVHEGSSGGPLFDNDGAIMGLNTLISYTAAENIAVSADHIKDLLYNK